MFSFFMEGERLRFIPVKIPNKPGARSEAECLDLLREVLSISSGWILKPMVDGKTNVILHGTHGSLDFSVVIRIFGENSELLIDRNQEKKNFFTLRSHALAPRIFAEFENGLVYEYLPGRALAPSEMAGLYREIALKIARWHCIHREKDSPSLIRTLREWGARSSDPLLSKYSVKRMIDFIEKRLSQTEEIEVGFCHNDLLSCNIIQRESGEVDFIDYEYANTNYIAFDIANHFLEYCGFDFDLSLYPAPSFIEKWLRAYAEGREESFSPERLQREIEMFTAASSVYWGLWGVIKHSAEKSCGSFDYREYAEKRFSHALGLILP
jgi:ethanolamine kinase